MKKHLLSSLFIIALFMQPSGASAQCSTGTKLLAGTYAVLTLTATSYIAAGDTITITTNFDANSRIFCNDGVLNIGGSYLATSSALTNSGIITAGTFTKTSSTGTCTVNPGASISITGNIQIEGNISNAGTIKSDTGTFTHNASTTYTLNNLSTGKLQISRNIIWAGNINNSGLIETTNSGTFGKIGSSGTITNQAGGTFHIRSGGQVSQIEGIFHNYDTVLIEGPVLKTSSSYALNNYAGAHYEVTGNLSHGGDIVNTGLIKVTGEIYQGVSSSGTITNNAGGTINVTDDIDVLGTLTNRGCMTIGDSLWKRNNSYNVVIDGGTITTVNFIQDNGTLMGGANAAARGYLRVSGFSQTLNAVPLSGFLDLGDAGHPGIAPYLDSESPSYAYPTANVTDYGASTMTDPTSITSSFGGAYFCNGQTVTLTVAGGSLSGPTAQWKWYQGTCGGTPAGTGPSITVTLSSGSNASYYVRGEDSCQTTCGGGSSGQVCVTSCAFIGMSPMLIGFPALAGNPTPLCAGQTTTLSVVNNPCNGPCNYYWSNGDTGITIMVTPATATTYSVNIKNSCGDSAYNSINIQSCATGIASYNASSGIAVYPNPSKGAFTLYLPSGISGKSEVKIFNLLGNEVRFAAHENMAGGNKKEILLENHFPGIYFLRIDTGEKTFTVKLMIQ